MKPTGHKTFDRAIGKIGVMGGNVIGDAQLSSFIRPFTETTCNGLNMRPGELQNFDLEPFLRPDNRMPASFEKAVREKTQSRSAVLYQFFHRASKTGRRITHGYLLIRQASEEGLVEILQRHVYTTPKSAQIMAVVEKCLVEKLTSEARSLKTFRDGQEKILQQMRNGHRLIQKSPAGAFWLEKEMNNILIDREQVEGLVCTRKVTLESQTETSRTWTLA